MPSIIINRAGQSPLVLERPDQVEEFWTQCEEALDLLIPELENEDVERVTRAFARYDEIRATFQQIKEQLPAFNTQWIEDFKTQAKRLANDLRRRDSG